MNKTFFFYDLETSGLSAKKDRIMQFAGQRTDMELNLVGEPINLLVKLSDDVLPSPYALMVTGISPQKTVEEGYSEAEFARKLCEEVFASDTIAVGYNNVRFDDEFVRYLCWRNFWDPYEWAWKNGRSRWDLLDVVRMTRALRPEGIEWPVDKEGKATNRLELLTKANGISHEAAHDAMSDVTALIGVTKLIREKQPQLFEYLLKMRDKKEVKKLVNLDDKKEFVYVSGRYEGEHEKATVVFPLTAGRNGNVVVYDLRYDPSELIKMSEKKLASVVFGSRKRVLSNLSPNDDQDERAGYSRSVIKELKYGHCPAVAPIGVLEQGDGWRRIGLEKEKVLENKRKLLEVPEFAERVREVYENGLEFETETDVESRLYEGFLNEADRTKAAVVRNAREDELADLHPDFVDERLAELLLHYKARNYPRSLSADEAMKWETWREARIRGQLPGYVKVLEELSETVDGEKQFVLQELQLWLERVVPGGY